MIISAVLAFSTLKPEGAVANVVSREPEFHCVGFCSHRTARDDERTFTLQPIQDINENGQLMIIDLVCSHESIPGVASSLINYVLAEQFSRRARNQQKYLAAYAYLVVGGTPPQPPAGYIVPQAALQNVMHRIGFVNVAMNPRPDFEYNGRLLRSDSVVFSQQLKDLFAPNLPLRNPCVIGRANGKRKCV